MVQAARESDTVGRRPTVALTVGDPAGIGPEVVLCALRERAVREALRLVVLGPGSLRPEEMAGVPADRAPASWPAGDLWIDTGGPRNWRMGEVQAACGRAALDALRRGAALAGEGAVDALVTGPVSKQALHEAGEPVEGQSELLGRWAGVERFQMMVLARGLPVLLLTRHLPLREALAGVDAESVLDHLVLLDATLRGWGWERPRIALAGLNPHAGEAGLLGSEEVDELEPAVHRARERGLEVRGPISPDAVFGQALRGAHDAVLALYHDQAFIPLKLLAPDEGVTFLAGLPYPRLSPVHGTAFDIAGQGRASPRNLIACLLRAAAWPPARAPVEAAAPRVGGTTRPDGGW